MSKSPLPYLHPEGAHPCRVERTPAPDLLVRCRACDARMEAVLLSACEGAGHEERVLLYLRCPVDGATGQVRLGRRRGAVLAAPPRQRLPHRAPEVLAGEAGYLGFACGCGAPQGAPANLLGHTVWGGRLLLLSAALLACGHGVELALPAHASFRVAPHRHGG